MRNNNKVGKNYMAGVDEARTMLGHDDTQPSEDCTSLAGKSKIEFSYDLTDNPNFTLWFFPKIILCPKSASLNHAIISCGHCACASIAVYFQVALSSVHYRFVTATGCEEGEPRKTFYFILSVHHRRLLIVAAYSPRLIPTFPT